MNPRHTLPHVINFAACPEFFCVVYELCKCSADATYKFNNWWETLTRRAKYYKIDDKALASKLDALIRFIGINNAENFDQINVETLLFESHTNDLIEVIVNYGKPIGLAWAWFIYASEMATVSRTKDEAARRRYYAIARENSAMIEAARK